MILVVEANGKMLGARDWREHGITFMLGQHLRNENWLG